VVEKKLVLCGVGAVGSHAALALRNLDVELALVDFDRVESKNLASQAYVKASLGKLKAEALKQQLLTFYGVSAKSFGVRLTESNAETLLAGAWLAVDAFDNAASRRLLSKQARLLGVPVLHAGLAADGSVGIVRWDERFEPDEEGSPGQATCETGEHLPLVLSLAANLALVVQDFHATGERRDVIVARRSVVTTA
jgi:molybdopterin/thiamine biosynthesis adenylyltransferase